MNHLPRFQIKLGQIAAIFLPLILSPVSSSLAKSVTTVEPAAHVKVVKHAKEKGLSVVRVNVTSQGYSFIKPWSKKAPYSHRGLGAVLPGGKVLVTAELVANANYIELEKAGSDEKDAAEIETVDYESNLAIIKPENPKFLKGLTPFAISEAKTNDTVSILQLVHNGTLLGTSALLTGVDVVPYPVSRMPLLIYRMTSALQYHENSFTLPVVKDHKLVGMVMRYDSHAKNVDIVPSPVIRHFLKDAASGHYRGFPRVGVGFASLRDPQLRHYVGLKNPKTGGIYLSALEAGGPGDKAGLKEGDVLLAIDGHDVDDDGDYNDPYYGKISINNLITLHHFDGQKVPFKIFRKGKTMTVSVTVKHRAASDYVSDPFIIDKAPKFYVLGGLVFEELSRPYLKSWGANWETAAPENFVYDDAYQSELFKSEQRKIVILSLVLPAPCNIGYQRLSALTVTKVNNKPVKNLEEFAAAVKHPVNGFQIINFKEDPGQIVLSADQIEQEQSTIQRNYNLPLLKRLTQNDQNDDASAE